MISSKVIIAKAANEPAEAIRRRAIKLIAETLVICANLRPHTPSDLYFEAVQEFVGPALVGCLAALQLTDEETTVMDKQLDELINIQTAVRASKHQNRDTKEMVEALRTIGVPDADIIAAIGGQAAFDRAMNIATGKAAS